MAGKNTLTGDNALIARKMLKDVTNFLDINGIEYWLEGGTLLGVIRENRLLPWDNDIDISVTEVHYHKLISIIKELPYRVRFRTFEKDDSPFKSGVNRLIKIRNRKLIFLKGEVCLEIFIKFKSNNEYFWQVGNKKKSAPAHYYESLVKYPFDDKEYLVPKQYEDYLTYRYGDWKTPVKEWDTFKDDMAIKADI